MSDPPGNAPPSRVFISYVHEDAPVADRLAQALRENGLDVWRDVERIPAGGSIADFVWRGLSSSDVVVVLTSHSADRSAWAATELAAAVSMQQSDPSKLLIPVLLEPGAEVPPLLADRMALAIGAEPGGVAKAARAISDAARSPRSTSLTSSEILRRQRLLAEEEMRLAVERASATFEIQSRQRQRLLRLAALMALLVLLAVSIAIVALALKGNSAVAAGLAGGLLALAGAAVAELGRFARMRARGDRD